MGHAGRRRREESRIELEDGLYQIAVPRAEQVSVWLEGAYEGENPDEIQGRRVSDAVGGDLLFSYFPRGFVDAGSNFSFCFFRYRIMPSMCFEHWHILSFGPVFQGTRIALLTERFCWR